MRQTHRAVKIRRPALPPLLEIDEDGVPVTELGIHEGRAWSGEGEEPGGVSLADWPTEFDD
jgi:hypothetical protein